jgi:hypothetical protein
VQGDDIGSTEKLLDIDVLDSNVDEFFIRVEVVRKDLAAKAIPEHLGHDGANLARPNYSNRLAIYASSNEACEIEVASSNTFPGLRDAPVKRNHQADCVFGNGMRRVRGHSHDGNAIMGGSLQVDVVEPGAAKGD